MHNLATCEWPPPKYRNPMCYILHDLITRPHGVYIELKVHQQVRRLWTNETADGIPIHCRYYSCKPYSPRRTSLSISYMRIADLYMRMSNWLCLMMRFLVRSSGFESRMRPHASASGDALSWLIVH